MLGLAVAAQAATATSDLLPIARGEVLIDFEAFPGPDGLLGTGDDVTISAPSGFSSQSTQVTTQFSTLGIVFLPDPPENNKNEILSDVSFQRTVGSAGNLLSTSRIDYPFGPIEAHFTVPVYEVSMAVGLGRAASSPNVLQIFDSHGVLIDSISGTDEIVTLGSPVPIDRFLVTATESAKQAAIDDVRFTVVPEPGSLSLVLMALGFVVCCGSRRLERR